LLTFYTGQYPKWTSLWKTSSKDRKIH